MLSALSQLAILAAVLASTAQAQTVLGVSVFSRHGDRTTRRFPGYELTNLGYSQNFFVGSQYRERYLSNDSADQILGISDQVYVPSQVFASAPQQRILQDTATAFLQGLYPPISDSLLAQTLRNGSESRRPLPGYQYVFLRGEPEQSPETISIKGDEGCPAYTSASESYYASEDYAQTQDETLAFYQRMWPYLGETRTTWTMTDMSFANAYDIFDAIHVASIHNTTDRDSEIAAADLDQLRFLANKLEHNLNFNATQPVRSIGGQTLGAAMMRQLNQNVATRGGNKFNLFAGSYDTMLAFFSSVAGLEGEDWTGLPEYASTFALELLARSNVTAYPDSTDDLAVRFRFWNGSSTVSPRTMQAYPLFGGQSEMLPWSEFANAMGSRIVSTLSAWCRTCGSKRDFCLRFNPDLLEQTLEPYRIQRETGGLSPVQAGVVGAMTSLVVCAIAALVLHKLRRPSRLGHADSESRLMQVDTLGSTAGEK